MTDRLYVYAHSRHETVYPSASAERGHPPPPDRAAERGAAPQTDPHRCPCWLWENHAGQRMGGWLRPASGLAIEAFHHAVAANDVERAGRLIEGKGMPLQFRGAMISVLNWLESLPKTILDARPSLWVTYASASTMTGQPNNLVEEKLQAAEAALQEAEPDDKTRDLVGHIAAIRAMLAVPANQMETIIAQSRRALEYLHCRGERGLYRSHSYQPGIWK